MAGTYPRIEHFVFLPERTLTLGAFRGIFASDDGLAARIAIPDGNAMAPPELTRDAPVPDVVHPFVPGFDPNFGDDFDALFIDGRDGFFGEGFGADEPLPGDERLDDGLAALAFAGVDGVVFDAFEQAERIEIGHDFLAGFVTIEAGVGAAVRVTFRIASDHFDVRKE